MWLRALLILRGILKLCKCERNIMMISLSTSRPINIYYIEKELKVITDF